MKKSSLLFLFALLMLSFSKEERYVSMIGKVIPDFSLKNVDETIFNTADYPENRGFIVIFTCNHCPFAKLYSDRFNELDLKYHRAGIPLIAINSMDSTLYEDETFVQMKAKSANDHFHFPYLHDDKQNVLKLFHATHTPQAFVIWRENNQWIVKYSGAIDDNGEHPEIAKSYIIKAVDELLQSKTVSEPETKAFGCKIYYRKS